MVVDDRVLGGKRGSEVLCFTGTGTLVVGFKGVTTTEGVLENAPVGEDDIVSPVELGGGGVGFALRVSRMSFLVSATFLDTSAMLSLLDVTAFLALFSLSWASLSTRSDGKTGGVAVMSVGTVMSVGIEETA